jgi:PTS system galactitol-specific IIA component
MSNALIKMLDPQAVFLRVDTQDAAAAISLLGGKLAELGHVTDDYVAAVLAREETMPTGLPLGEINVAVPHTDPEFVRRPAVAVATLRQPVAFHNMEEPDESLPVSIVFLLALKDKDKQIEMLQAIASLIQSGPLLQRLTAVESKEEAMALLADAA